MSEVTAAAASAATTGVALVSNEGTHFPISVVGANTSSVLQAMLRDHAETAVVKPGHAIPIAVATDACLAALVPFMEALAHNPDASAEKLLAACDMSSATNGALSLLNAAHYLEIPGALTALCAHVAAALAGKTPDEIRQLIGDCTPPTPEMMNRYEAENKWLADE